MITPSIATDDVHQAANTFRECGWRILFESAPDNPDPTAVVSLSGNTVMFTTAPPADVHPDAIRAAQRRTTFYMTVTDDLKKLHKLHRPCSPGPLRKRPEDGGGKGFEVTIQDVGFVITAMFGD